ncbi:MAG: acetolactate synthase large subunit, partial [Gammaproteobacteria bacterium]|nr:acetolactate synthase large subunit [Gammaproteobacteria bacterium]
DLRWDNKGEILNKSYSLSFGLNYGNPDFVQYANAYGAHGHLIESTDSFAPTLEKCLNAKGVQVVVVPVDYSENSKVLTQELLAKTCML